jgi:hypothetical protein
MLRQAHQNAELELILLDLLREVIERREAEAALKVPF